MIDESGQRLVVTGYPVLPQEGRVPRHDRDDRHRCGGIHCREKESRSVSGNRLVTRATVCPTPSEILVKRPLSRGILDLAEESGSVTLLSLHSFKPVEDEQVSFTRAQGVH